MGSQQQITGKKEGNITEIDVKGHSHSGVSPSPEAQIQDYQSKPH